MRKIRKIILHVTDTPDDLDIGVREIKQYHINQNGWKDIGYHYVIRRDGYVEVGRPITSPGAHAKGNNHDSIGIAWVGRDEMTWKQRASLLKLVMDLLYKFNLTSLHVHGHYEFNQEKTCPNFSMEKFTKILDEIATL